MKLVPVKASRALARSKHRIRRNSPHILFGAGIVGVVGSAVLACRATLKLEETLDDIHESIDVVRGLSESSRPVYKNDHDRQKDMAVVYGQATFEIVKLYGPSVLLGVASIAALTGSHVQLTKRNAALTATLVTVTRAFDEYRDRVRKEIGDVREEELYTNLELKQVNKDEPLAAVKIDDANGLGPHVRLFDECSTAWEKNSEVNRVFLQACQEHMTRLLHARGHLFLNEVYDALGLEHTSAGSITGWIISKDGDNYVDFGMFHERNSRFLNNLERSCWLDFNVDGIIYDKI